MEDWTNIIRSIEHGQCVLFLGPELFHRPNQPSLEQKLQSYLSKKEHIQEFISTYYPNDGFYLFQGGDYPSEVIWEIQEFYKQSFPKTEAIMSRISKIKFQYILSLTPDNLMERVFQQNKFNFSSDFYYKKNPPNEFFTLPTVDKPLIYNLLGDVNKEESLVLTHNHLFDYLQSIFIGKSMHPELKEALTEARYFLFVGLPFDKWYMQLLLRVLSLHVPRFRRFANEPSFPVDKTMYEAQFGIKFVQYNCEKFIDELIEECKKDGEHLFRTTQTIAEPLPLDEIKEMVASDNVLSAMDRLKKLLEAGDEWLQKQVGMLILLQQRLSNTQNNFRSGIITMEVSNTEQSRISKAFLELIRKLENRYL